MRSSGLVLFACAGLMLSGGAILAGSTSWSLLRMSYYFWTTELGVELSAGVVLIAGALLCLPVCWLATIVPYHPKSACLNTISLGAVTVALIVLCIGLAALAPLAHAVRDTASFNASMLRAMATEPYDPAVKSAFGAMQLELKCCGVNSHEEWFQYRRSLPPACCGRVWNGKMQRLEQCQVPAFGAGCLRAALAELRYHQNSLAALAAALIIVMAVTFFTISYLAVSGALGHGEVRYKAPQPLRLACLHAPAALNAPPTLQPPPALRAPLVPHAPPALHVSPAMHESDLSRAMLDMF